MKKVLLLILIVFFSVVGIQYIEAATPDTTPPVLKGISIKNPQKTYNVGDKVYLKLKANDDISGLYSITMHIQDVNNEYNDIDYVRVYDIENDPYFIVPRLTGKEVNISVTEITLSDYAANTSTYTSNKKNVYGKIKYLGFKISFKSVYTGEDIKGPELINMTVDKDNIKYGQSTEITIEAIDDISGLSSASIGFCKMNNDGSGDPCFYKDLSYDAKSGTIKGKIPAPPFNGKYHIYDVTLVDNDFNTTNYSEEEFNYGSETHESLQQFVAFLVSGAPDAYETGIKISKIDFEYKKLVAPSVYEIGIKLNKDVDYIDQVNITVCPKSNPNCDNVIFLFKEKGDYYKGTIDIDQFSLLGVYQLKSAWLYSGDGEEQPDYWDEFDHTLKVKRTNLFEVVEDNAYDVITSTTDKNLLKKIKNAKKDAKIAINSLNDSILKKEVFEAIKGTDKTIYVESEGIQWVFKGKEIKNPKEIDVEVSINRIYEDELNNSIGNYLDNSIVISFADNGELPGLALIRVKTDYVLRDYLGTENLQVYYYNGSDNQMFDIVANNISMTESGNFEFYITHNSPFIITSNKIDDKYVSNKTEDLSLNNSQEVVEKVSKKRVNKTSVTDYIVYTVACISFICLIICVISLVTRKTKKN